MNIELEKLQALVSSIEKIWKELEEVKQELEKIAFDLTTDNK